MNQRLKRKIEKRRRQQICEALDLCLQINGLQKSEKELTGNHPTAIMHFWGTYRHGRWGFLCIWMEQRGSCYPTFRGAAGQAWENGSDPL